MSTYCRKQVVAGWRFSRWAALLLVLCALMSSGCSRSVRPQAAQVAASGKATAEQMATYYGTLAKDTNDVWELTAFKRGFTGLPETSATAELEAEYTKRHRALLARKQFANAIASTYAQFGNLTSYDSSKEVLAAVNRLNAQVKALKDQPVTAPSQVGATPETTASPSLATNALNSLSNELVTVAENRVILRENKRLVKILEDIEKVFDAELPVYKSIAEDKKIRYAEVAKHMVDKGYVDSTALVNQVLTPYDLKWTTPTPPFSDTQTKEGIKRIIDARANPIAQTSKDAGETLSSALAELLSLHKKIVGGESLSFGEMAEQNALVQNLLDILNSKTNIDVRRILAVVEEK